MKFLPSLLMPSWKEVAEYWKSWECWERMLKGFSALIVISASFAAVVILMDYTKFLHNFHDSVRFIIITAMVIGVAIWPLRKLLWWRRWDVRKYRKSPKGIEADYRFDPPQALIKASNVYSTAFYNLKAAFFYSYWYSGLRYELIRILAAVEYKLVFHISGGPPRESIRIRR